MPIVIRPIEPNNVRNRWRRMRDAQEAYGWARHPFRNWVDYGRIFNAAYYAEPHHRKFNITLRNANQ